MHVSRLPITLAALAALALGAAACNADEQDRVLFHEKGVYQGERDTPLADEKLDDLRRRALRQAG